MTNDERREQVLSIAAGEFAINGYHGTSAEVIARSAGISQPYVFRLFGSKSALFNEVVKRSFERMTDDMLASAEGLDGIDALMAMGNSYKQKLRKDDDLLLQLQGFAACAEPEVRATVRESFGAQWTAVAKASGATALQMKVFMGLGLLLNDLAAIDVGDIGSHWARSARTAVPREVYEIIADHEGDTAKSPERKSVVHQRKTRSRRDSNAGPDSTQRPRSRRTQAG